MKLINYKNPEEYDFIDSIIFGIAWDDTMKNLQLKIDQYLGKDKNKNIILEFFNCTAFHFQMSPHFKKEQEVWSYFTIVGTEIEEFEKGVRIRFFRDFSEDLFLTIDAENIYISEI